MLKMTDIKLELITDMFQFIEKGMGARQQFIYRKPIRKSKQQIRKNYDKNKDLKYILYLDANNVNGWAMSQYLPSGGFKRMTEKEIEKLNLLKYTEDSKKGLILDVDLEYP